MDYAAVVDHIPWHIARKDVYAIMPLACRHGTISTPHAPYPTKSFAALGMNQVGAQLAPTVVLIYAAPDDGLERHCQGSSNVIESPSFNLGNAQEAGSKLQHPARPRHSTNALIEGPQRALRVNPIPAALFRGPYSDRSKRDLEFSGSLTDGGSAPAWSHRPVGVGKAP